MWRTRGPARPVDTDSLVNMRQRRESLEPLTRHRARSSPGRSSRNLARPRLRGRRYGPRAARSTPPTTTRPARSDRPCTRARGRPRGSGVRLCRRQRSMPSSAQHLVVQAASTRQFACDHDVLAAGNAERHATEARAVAAGRTALSSTRESRPPVSCRTASGCSSRKAPLHHGARAPPRLTDASREPSRLSTGLRNERRTIRPSPRVAELPGWQLVDPGEQRALADLPAEQALDATASGSRSHPGWAATARAEVESTAKPSPVP